ncbi:MAG: hypothetical protein ACRETE_11900, partial [Stenotrophobium sp.]
MTKLTRVSLTTIAAACLLTLSALPAQAGSFDQASSANLTDRVATAAGHYFASQGSAVLQELRKQIEAGLQPNIQRLPTVTVTPTDEELRDADIDPAQWRAART